MVPVSWTPWTIIRLLSSILGIVGNLLVTIVIWKRRLTSLSMDILIGALAVADLLTSVFIVPLPRAVVVPSSLMGELYCRLIFTSYFMWSFVGSSIYILTFISVERLVAVMFPIHWKYLSGKRRILIAVAFIYVTSMTFQSYLIHIFSVDRENLSCIVRYESVAAQKLIGSLAFLVYFLIPTVVMFIAQSLTAFTLHRKSLQLLSGLSQKTRSNPSYNLLLAKQAVLKLLVVIILIFVICWGPANVAYLLYNLGILDASYLYGPIDSTFTLLAYFNSCLNPVVYAIRYPKFRVALKELFTCGKLQQESLFESKGAMKRETDSQQGA